MEHVLKEVISEVDKDGGGTLSLDEFEHIMEIIALREGFTRSEHKLFTDLFVRFDNDKSGEIDTRELSNILAWLGFAFDQGRLEAIVRDVDVDGSGSISESEFMVCMRKVREQEIRILKQAIDEADYDGSQTISGRELDTVLSTLGYIPDRDVVKEALIAA